MGAPERIDVMIAGAQRAGTSTLRTALGAHPGIVTHDTAELPWFVESSPEASLRAAIARSFGDLDDADDRLVLAKSAGVMALGAAQERLAAHNPACRIVVVLRDPVERAWSAYWFERRAGREPAATFEEAIERDPATAPGGDRAHQLDYLGRGDYLPQLQALEQRFDAPPVIVRFDDLVADQRATVGGILDALGLDPSRLPPGEAVVEHGAAAARSTRIARLLRSPGPRTRAVARRLPRGLRLGAQRTLLAANERPLEVGPMAPETRTRLAEHFAPRNAALAAWLDRDLSAWT